VLRAGFAIPIAIGIISTGLNTSHFDLKVKTEIHYFTSPETANSSFDLSKGEVDTETPGQAPRNSFDLKKMDDTSRSSGTI